MSTPPAAGPPPPEAPAEPTEPDDAPDRIQRIVAVLIMVVTLMGAGVAFLQIQAGDREAAASRSAEEYSVRTLAALVSAGSGAGRRETTYDISNDLFAQSIYLDATAGRGGPASGYAAALSSAYGQVSNQVADEAKGLLGADLGSAGFEQFYVGQYEPAYAAVEYQKAYARERDGWGSKGGRYVTVITVFAVALFLLGLTLTVPSVARPPFLVMGTAVALAAAAWGTAIWLQRVESPAAAAIEAYAAGQAKLDVVSFDPTADQADHDQIVADMTRAIEIRPGFREAYLGRGSAYFNADLTLTAGGPKGSARARDDWAHAVALDPNDFVGWVDLGAAQFWLGDYQGSLESTRRAIELKGDEPVSNLNEALLLAVTGDDGGYVDQMGRVRDVMAAIPSWLRDAVVNRYGVVIDKAIHSRPALVPIVTRLREDLLRMVHEIDVSSQVNGTSNPPVVTATVERPTFELDATRTELRVSFMYAGMEAGQPWLYRVYVNGFRNDNFSIASQPFDAARFDVPDGGIILTFTDQNGFPSGQVIRVEIFVEGNLLNAGEFTVP